MKRKMFLALAMSVGIAVSNSAIAQEADESALAKKTQNPVSDLISVPFQNNMSFGFGPGDDILNVLNIQPVIPVKITENINLISRAILPVVYQPEVVPGIGSKTGLADLNYSAYFSPAKPGKLIWGVGPTFLLPTATDVRLGGKFGVGPAGVALRMQGPWVYGVLVNNIWSVAGRSGAADVNQMLIQYFVNYNLPKGWYLASAPIITANWEAVSGNRWTVPIGAGAGKIFRIGKLPINASVQGFYNVEKPVIGPDWSMRFQLQFLFPKG